MPKQMNEESYSILKSKLKAGIPLQAIASETGWSVQSVYKVQGTSDYEDYRIMYQPTRRAKDLEEMHKFSHIVPSGEGKDDPNSRIFQRIPIKPEEDASRFIAKNNAQTPKPKARTSRKKKPTKAVQISLWESFQNRLQGVVMDIQKTPNWENPGFRAIRVISKTSGLEFGLVKGVWDTLIKQKKAEEQAQAEQLQKVMKHLQANPDTLTRLLRSIPNTKEGGECYNKGRYNTFNPIGKTNEHQTDCAEYARSRNPRGSENE